VQRYLELFQPEPSPSRRVFVSPLRQSATVFQRRHQSGLLWMAQMVWMARMARMAHQSHP
jgi:hypothetical protein